MTPTERAACEAAYQIHIKGEVDFNTFGNFYRSGFAAGLAYAREESAAELADAKFRPLGDNHHNAALCPHCGEPLRKALDENTALRQRIERLERELEFAHRTAAQIVGVTGP